MFQKCFPNVPSRKRSRSDVLSNDRNSALFSTERLASGTGTSKMGTQSHSNMGGFEVEQQKSDERAKTAIPSKRTRTSMVDPRVCTLDFLDFVMSCFIYCWMSYFLSKT